MMPAYAHSQRLPYNLERHRFRFIGATALSFVSLAFEGHNLSVIEADGGYTKPANTSFMQIGPGQRYSALLTTKICDELWGQRRFWIQTETRERPTLYRGYALLVYSDECDVQVPTTPPLTLPNTTLGWLDYELGPLAPNDFPSLNEVTRRVTVTVQMIVNGTMIWAENGYLVNIYEHDESGIPNYANAIANGGMDDRTRAFPAKIGEVLEIVIQNSGGTSGGLDVHSFHAHGAHVYDIGAGNGTYDAYANEEKLRGTYPVKRDTTVLYRYGTKTNSGADARWRAWRLRITEPGVWMIHCHTLQVNEQINIALACAADQHYCDYLQHMIMGMQTVWVFGDTSDILKLPKP